LLGLIASYFLVGVGVGIPYLVAQEHARFPQAPAWLFPVTGAAFFLVLLWLDLGLGLLGPEALSHTLAPHGIAGLVRLAQGIHRLSRPFSRSALALGNTFSRWLGGKPLQRGSLVTEEQIKTLVTAGEQVGAIEEEERAMIYSIFRLGDTLTREIMVPRIDVVALDVNTPLREALHLIVDSGHSRIPTYEETVDNVVGILYVKDLLQYWNTAGEVPPLRQILRPAYFVPEAKRLDDLLREMQHNKIQQAIVIDEYGGVAGLVTLEDIMEEIVGEIQDEYDRDEPQVVDQGDGAYLFDGRIPLDDVQELLEIPLPLEEADSLGGFVYNQLGHIPSPGEALRFGPVTFEVVETANRRIRRVKALKAATKEQET
jgi:CBS domain containing-hemolysin-like protein